MKRLDEKFDAQLADIIKQAAVERDEATGTLAKALLEDGRRGADSRASRKSAVEKVTPQAQAAKSLMLKDLSERFTIDDAGIMTSYVRMEAFEPTYAFVQLKGTNPPALEVSVLELKEADQLNQITWKGFVSASFSSFRISKTEGEDGPPIWGDWEPFDREQECSFFYSIIEKRGQLQVESRIFKLGFRSMYGDTAAKKMLPDTLDDATDSEQ